MLAQCGFASAWKGILFGLLFTSTKWDLVDDVWDNPFVLKQCVYWHIRYF